MYGLIAALFMGERWNGEKKHSGLSASVVWSSFPFLRFQYAPHPRSIHTNWQWPLAVVHSIMMVKSAKFVVYAPAERAETLPPFLLYPYMNSVADTLTRRGIILCTPHYFSSTPYMYSMPLPASKSIIFNLDQHQSGWRHHELRAGSVLYMNSHVFHLNLFADILMIYSC